MTLSLILLLWACYGLASCALFAFTIPHRNMTLGELAINCLLPWINFPSCISMLFFNHMNVGKIIWRRK